MMELNVLFLGGAKRVSVANHLKNEGAKRGLDVSIFSYELDEQVPIACVGKVVIGKRWRDTDLYDHLVKTIAENNITMVLPFVDPAIGVCSKLKELCHNVFIPVSDFKLCQTMFDKVLSSEWFKENDIKQPKCYTDKAAFEYPVILKPRTGSASKGILVCKSEEELTDTDLTNYVIQDFIGDHTEFSVDCYVNLNGNVTSVVPRIRLETAGGEATKSKTVYEESIIAESKKILTSGLFRGPITIQFIKDNTNGNVYVMEINPRLGGGVVTSIGAGSGIMAMLLDEFQGKVASEKTDWNPNTVMVRYFNEVIFSCR